MKADNKNLDLLKEFISRVVESEMQKPAAIKKGIVLRPPQGEKETVAFEELLKWALWAMGEKSSTADKMMEKGKNGDWSEALDALDIYLNIKKISHSRG